MATITTRTAKGSPLTHQEMDDNFSNINDATLPTGGTTNQVLAKTSATNYAVGWTTLTDTNTTYAISAETATGGVNLRLTGSDSSTDDVKLAAGSNVTLTRTDASTITIDASGGITELVSDTSPQLGGNLDVNGYSIVSASNGDINITPNGTGSVVIDGNEFPQTQGANFQILVADGSGLLEWKYPERLMAYVYNADSVTINKGEPVYVFSAQGDQISVKRALNTSDATSAQTLGLANESITATGSGYVVCQGPLTNIDTSAYTAGQALYLGSTSGSKTTTKPYAPNHLVYLGFVEKVNASSGRIYVRTQNGYELDEIHDVNINHNVSIANKDYLVYNSSNSLWENRQLDIVNDTTPQLGGNLDVNGANIVSASNGNIVIAPNGTGTINLTSTGNIIVGNGANTATITTNGVTAMLFNTNSGANSASIRLGNTNSGDIELSTIFGALKINPQFASPIVIGNGANTQAITTNGATAMLFNTNSGSNSASIRLGNTNSGDIELNTIFGSVKINPSFAGPIIIGNGANTQSITTNGATAMLLNTNSGTNTPSIRLDSGASGAINLIPYTGKVVIGNGANAAKITSSGFANLYLETNDGANSSSIEIGYGSSGNVSLTSLFGYIKLIPTYSKVLVGNGANTAKISSNGYTSLYLETNDGSNSSSITIAPGSSGDITLGTMFGSVRINPTYAGAIIIGNGANTQTITTNGATAMVLNTNSGGNSASIRIGNTNSGDIELNTIFGAVKINPSFAGAIVIGNGANTQAITTNGATSMLLNTNSGGNSGSITIGSGINGSITISPAAGGSGKTNITNLYAQNAVYAIGNSGPGVLTPDASNGRVQTITANGNFTLSAFTNPVSGQKITFIITQDATGNRTLTSSMKFEGGSKTLSTAANAIDILDVWYVGTTYYASLTKGYA